ncbi:MAG: hypothetical protein J2P46_21955 [Zavarzinella sp.]|nr:hypothetical protein [Zavarzinella sp.]
MSFHPTADTATQRFLRGVLLLVVCGLCGTYDILNTNFARWVASASSTPEEEEVHAKDRAALVGAVQPVRRGGLKPRPAVETPVPAAHRHSGGHLVRTATFATTERLTGAGIFQHC